MFENVFQSFAQKLLEAALKLNGAKKISKEEFKNIILNKDSKSVTAISNLLNISEEDVKKGINQYKKLLEKNKK